MWQRWMGMVTGAEEKICRKIKGVEICGIKKDGGRTTSHRTEVETEFYRGENELKGRLIGVGGIGIQ